MSLADAGQRLTIAPNQSGFGAEVTGLDLSRPLPPATLDAVKAAFLAHGVLWFPGQPLDHDQLEAFTLQFGDFGWDPYIAPIEDRPHILEVRREAEEKTTVFGAAGTPTGASRSRRRRPPSSTPRWSRRSGATRSTQTPSPPMRPFAGVSRDAGAAEDHPLGDAALRTFRPLRQGRIRAGR